EDGVDDAGFFGLDFVEDLHGFDEADGGVGGDLLADFDEAGAVGVGGEVAGADHWGVDGGAGGGRRCGSGGGGGGRGGRLGGGARGVLSHGRLADDSASADGDGFFAVPDLDFGEVVLGHQGHEFFELADVDHAVPNDVQSERRRHRFNGWNG